MPEDQLSHTIAKAMLHHKVPPHAMSAAGERWRRPRVRCEGEGAIDGLSHGEGLSDGETWQFQTHAPQQDAARSCRTLCLDRLARSSSRHADEGVCRGQY